jgi:tetratricopeptide (TPR) repeat protein
MSDVENPYKVLGVERSADERAVKKAYVALVRKFSPEKHPEEFKKIRAAYELLLDATARARFDEGEKGYAEYGEELSRRLEDFDKATADGNLELAREILLPLAEKFPDVTVVKEKLGFLHLNAGEHERAIDVFTALVAKEPENARHLLHSAFALARLDRHPQVEKALREALRLEPKNVRVGLAFIDFLIERGRTVEAVKAGDEIIPLLEPNSVQVAVFLLRQVEADATGGHDVTVSKEVSALRDLFRDSKEDNIGPFIAGQIASTAAKLFAMKNPSAANRLLVLCAEFDPTSALVWPLPAEVKVRPEDLPSAFREWLEHLSADLAAPFVLRHPTSLMNTALVVLACGVFVGGAFMVGGATAAANHASIVFALIVLIAGGAAVMVTLGRLLSERGGKLRTITTLHPLYLIRATPALVELYPLFMLTGTSGSHQHTNGVYTGTALTFAFGDNTTGGTRSHHVNVAGQAVAQEFVDTLLQVRGRSLELLAEGALEAEHLVDHLPPRALKDLPLPPGRMKKLARPLAVGLAAALVIFVPIFATSASADDLAIQRAATSPDEEQRIAAYRTYLADHPQGRHRDLAEAHLHDVFEQMLVGLPLDPTNPGEAALVKAVEHIRDHGGHLAVDAEIEGVAFGRDAKRATELHLKRALGASGFTPLLSREVTVDGAHLVVKIVPGPARTLTAEMSTLESCGAKVEVAIEIAGKRIFERSLDVAAPALVASRRDAAAESAARANLSVALEAATAALGLHAPAARLGGGK